MWRRHECARTRTTPGREELPGVVTDSPLGGSQEVGLCCDFDTEQLRTRMTHAKIAAMVLPHVPRSRWQVVPRRWRSVVFAFFLSALMTLLVSGLTTAINLGLDGFTIGRWLAAFVRAWPITFPSVLVVAPIVHRLVAKVVAPG